MFAAERLDSAIVVIADAVPFTALGRLNHAWSPRVAFRRALSRASTGAYTARRPWFDLRQAGSRQFPASAVRQAGPLSRFAITAVEPAVAGLQIARLTAALRLHCWQPYCFCK